MNNTQSESPVENPGYNVSLVGVWGDEIEFKVEGERTIAYAAATNDPIAAHLDGTVAPPVFAVVPITMLMAETTMSVVPDELIMKILHGEHDFRFHRPIVPGDVLTVRGKVVGIEGKSSGTVVTTLLESRDATGALVNEQYFTGFFRGGVFHGTVGEPSPAHAFDVALLEREPDAVSVQKIDADQTFRYAEPAGDPMPIHLDADFAREMGLPGIIVHGLCTIAFVSHALINEFADGDSSRLKRLAVRLSSPALPEQTLTTSTWAHGTTASGRASYAFETESDGGKYVVRDGLAEFTQGA
ncbi:MaoC/PaaZ C-terminal domain-containing protein [Nocardioides sp. WS12]|uniref:MaoC/PaaZ C-terminal domain-containing protein n=1 Tax=Nocardioides sp. WS12 TaxID=2486272 RepID=UPI0015F9178C|nr:MaoC/PaaZ C-terminal domain-containing protein [Nocardioides sp. WS12]